MLFELKSLNVALYPYDDRLSRIGQSGKNIFAMAENLVKLRWLPCATYTLAFFLTFF
jgi:hypothetical protein